MHIVTLKVLLTLTGIVFISSCAGVKTSAQPEPVPEIKHGLLLGCRKSNTVFCWAPLWLPDCMPIPHSEPN